MSGAWVALQSVKFYSGPSVNRSQCALQHKYSKILVSGYNIDRLHCSALIRYILFKVIKTHFKVEINKSAHNILGGPFKKCHRMILPHILYNQVKTNHDITLKNTATISKIDPSITPLSVVDIFARWCCLQSITTWKVIAGWVINQLNVQRLLGGHELQFLLTQSRVLTANLQCRWLID